MTAGDSDETGCVFCARLAGTEFWITVLETPYSVAAVANHQRAPGSLIIVPRRHAVSLRFRQ